MCIYTTAPENALHTHIAHFDSTNMFLFVIHFIVFALCSKLACVRCNSNWHRKPHEYFAHMKTRKSNNNKIQYTFERSWAWTRQAIHSSSNTQDMYFEQCEYTGKRAHCFYIVHAMTESSACVYSKCYVLRNNSTRTLYSVWFNVSSIHSTGWHDVRAII